jgi:hypothetical protein
MSSILNILDTVLLHDYPWRVPLVRRLIRYFPSLTPYSYRASIDAVDRPQHAYCILEAVELARNLGINKISVIEFGVAGGNGLTNLEWHIEEIKKEFDFECELYGFDTGVGMPASDDHRDLRYNWGEGIYRMDRQLLESRLKFAELVIGDVKKTCGDFFKKYDPAPVGCIFFDLDYYTSTCAAFEIFNSEPKNRLPRIQTYFDDIISIDEHVGELCAIQDFNDSHDQMKIGKRNMFCYMRKVPKSWNEKVYMMHDFAHPLYNTYLREHRDMPLDR